MKSSGVIRPFSGHLSVSHVSRDTFSALWSVSCGSVVLNFLNTATL